jgi:hypothetical protein
MATAPDGWVSETRLQELLARQGETFDLDYKSVLDIKDDPRHRLKLVKLVAAMTALGGDIVVGVDGRGKPTGKVTQGLAPVYDEANLRSILRGYLPPELRVHSQAHVIDGDEVILVRVEAAEGGPLALTKDGIHHDARNQPAHEFRTGERYIRDGTSNALFVGDPHQIALLLKQRSVAPPAADPADAMTFAVAPAVLAAAARELLRRQDDVPLRGLLGSADAELRHAVEQRAWAEITGVLDRLLVLACTYLRLGAEAQAREVLEVFRCVFELGFDESDVGRQTTDAWSPRLWLETTARAEILGALALRLRRWDFVRDVALWKPAQVTATWVASWIRGAMTTKNYESWPRHDDQKQTPKGIPEVAVEIAATLPQVSEDIAGDDSRLRESIGQFDFAVYLMSVAALESALPRVVMTDAVRVGVGREGLSRLLRLLFTPGPARQAIFPLEDSDLAFALRRWEYSLMERGYAAFGWYGETEDFIDKHYPTETDS